MPTTSSSCTRRAPLNTTHSVTHGAATKPYNGFDSKLTIGGMQRCSAEPIADHGVIGHGVLLDVPRYKDKPHLDRGEGISLQDLLDTAAHQKVSIEKHDILVVRTGWLPLGMRVVPEAFFPNGEVVDPGLQYSPELVEWFHEMEIPSLSADNLGCEMGIDPNLGCHGALHCALQRNLGIPFNEVVWLEDLAADCAEDGQYTFLFAGRLLEDRRSRRFRGQPHRHQVALDDGG